MFGLFLATASCIILRELNPGDDYMAAVQVIYVLAAFMIARFTQGFLYGTFAAVAGVLLTNFDFHLSVLGVQFHAARLSCNDFVCAHCLRHNKHDDGPHQGTGTASA